MVFEIDGGHFRREVKINPGFGEVLGVAPFNLLFIGDKSFGELGAVDREVGLKREDGDLAVEAFLTKAFDGADCSGATVVR